MCKHGSLQLVHTFFTVYGGLKIICTYITYILYSEGLDMDLYSPNVHSVQWECRHGSIKYVHSVQYLCTFCTVFMYILYSVYVHSVEYLCTFCTVFMYIMYRIYVHSVQYLYAFCTVFMYIQYSESVNMIWIVHH